MLVENDGHLGRCAGRAWPRDFRIHDTSKWVRRTGPKGCFGCRLPRGARGSLGHWVHIKDGRSPITSASCRAPGTRVPAMRGSGGALEAALLGPPWPNPSSRWRSCVRCTRSTPVWRAGCTSSMRPARAGAREGVVSAVPAGAGHERRPRTGPSCTRCRCGSRTRLVLFSILILAATQLLHRPPLHQRAGPGERAFHHGLDAQRAPVRIGGVHTGGAGARLLGRVRRQRLRALVRSSSPYRGSAGEASSGAALLHLPQPRVGGLSRPQCARRPHLCRYFSPSIS